MLNVFFFKSIYHTQIPQFTNPTEIIKIGAISPMEFVDVVQVTFANDHCAEFDCPSVTCTNDASQSFAYFVSRYMLIFYGRAVTNVFRICSPNPIVKKAMKYL